MRITYIGGPTAIVEHAGARLLTDPTFDPAGERYELPAYTLAKTDGPAIAADAIGRIDAVLLSHDHHVDNLDRAGRALARMPAVLTSVAGAGRLGGTAVGLEPWQTHALSLANGATLTVTATPARHGPEHGDRGPVVGFVLQDGIYVSGDTVWYDGVRAVAERVDVRVAVLFMGAARVRAAGPSHLTFTADEGVEAARAMPHATIVPLHFEGWEHFSETRDDIARAFARAGMASRVVWPERGRAVDVA